MNSEPSAPDTGVSDRFYVIARESGQERNDLPTWADRTAGNIVFNDPLTSSTTRKDVAGVPGAFQLIDVLSPQECDQFVAIGEQLGFHIDAPVSLPHSVRHNTNFNWIVADEITNTIWQRCSRLVPELVGAEPALGLNARFRFYRYAVGDYFSPHTDGAWPGTRVVDGKLVHDAFGDRLSQMSYLQFLSDGYQGGRTVFYIDSDTGGPARHPDRTIEVAVSTPKGAALCFPHGFHPLHCLHGGETISAGVKYIIRTDVLFGIAQARPLGEYEGK